MTLTVPAFAALRRVWPSVLPAALALGWLAARCVGAGDTPPKPIVYDDEDESPALANLPRGERAARRACTICHLFPDPSLLDKKNWYEQILPRMKVELDIAKPDYSTSPDGELLRQRHIYPDQPRIPVEDWPWIEEYYLQHAPDAPVPQDPRPEIKVGLPQFSVEPSRLRLLPPSTTLVKISPKTHRLYVGDDHTQSLSVLNAEGELIETIKVGNVPTDVVETERGLYVVCIGDFFPREVYRGEFLFLPKQGDHYGPRQVLLKELPRTVQARFADLNGDGREDFVLCMFGNRTGRFSWFENLGGERYKEHVLANKSGAMYCYVHDFNADGKPDLAVLMAQELEMLIILLNDGKGNFISEEVFRQPPVYGHSYFELVDFDGDGRQDILVTNGDNGEYNSPLKKYHAIRLLLNKGGTRFEQAWEFPLNGAYHATARDFRGTGRLDIAAVSYFPDWVNCPRESFVFLANQGGLKFAPATFPQCISGNWLVMDAGDMDGDGDEDLALGSYVGGPGSAPPWLVKTWTDQGASVQILRNTLKDHRAIKPTAKTAP